MLKSILEKLGIIKEKSIPVFTVNNNYNEIFQYEYIPTFDNDTEDYMIRFSDTKDGNQLIGKLLLLFEDINFEAGEAKEVWMNDEIWISAKSPNGNVLITKNIYDFVFIMANDNKSDLDIVENVMNKSMDFKKIKLE